MNKKNNDYDLLYCNLYRTIYVGASTLCLGFPVWDWNEFGPTYIHLNSSPDYYLPKSYTTKSFSTEEEWEIELHKFRKKRTKVLQKWKHEGLHV